MPALRSHTHLHAAQADTQTEACKRVCLPKRTADRNNAAKMKDRFTKDKNGQLVTGGCCQWRDSASYDSDMVLESFVLLRKFSVEPPNSTPPIR